MSAFPVYTLFLLFFSGLCRDAFNLARAERVVLPVMVDQKHNQGDYCGSYKAAGPVGHEIESASGHKVDRQDERDQENHYKRP